jgi:uncharacterized membrane protein YeaQ/YmgE (transglycosylase-associated protein family)
MFAILGKCLAGLIVGAIAKWLMPGKDSCPLWVTMLLGIGGSMVGGYLGHFLGLYEAGEGAGWVMSVVGAMLLLWGYRLVKAQPEGPAG